MDADLDVGILGKNELIREGLGRILSEQGFRIVSTSSRVEDFARGTIPVDMILIDANACGAGLADCISLRQALPGVRIVLMADEFSMDEVADAYNSDAVDGYLVKVIACKPLAGALRLVAMGEKLFPSQIMDSLGTATHAINLRSHNAREGGGNLSARESEILCCLVDGDANKVISRRLNISDATVKVHIKAILRKLRVANRTQAAIWAVTRGLGAARAGLSQPSAPERVERLQMLDHQAVAA